MDYRSLTLALLVLFFSLLPQFLSSALHSPTPASSPTHPPPTHILSVPAGLTAHAPTIFRNHRMQSPPHHQRHKRPPHLPPSPPPGKLNLGKKVGLLFAAIAVVLQVAFAAFLIYKRCQLKKMGGRYRTRVSS